MAEKEKKTNSHESEGGLGLFGDVFFWLLFVVVLFSVIIGFFSSLNIFSNFPSLTDIVVFIFDKIQILSVFISLVFFAGILYFNFKIGEILHKHEGHDDGHSSTGSHAPIVSHTPDKRWQNVLNKISSPNEGDWRIAIIEADIILDDMLARMGYHGDGVAEKLKKVEKSDFKTIESAWTAHKMRNEIAHSGTSFHLGRSQAEKTINLFKEVFEEFFFI